MATFATVPPDVPNERADVVVIGGGLAGLTAAATAAGAGVEVVLLDAHGLGGRARVDRRGDYLFNRGPRALYISGAGRQVLDGLGVATHQGGAPVLRGAMALHRGRLALVPQGLTSLLRSSILSTREKVRAAAVLARLPRLYPHRFAGLSADEAIATLALGPVASDLLKGLVRLSTYSADTHVFDGASAIEQVQRAMSAGVIYLDGGWQTLVDGLAERAEHLGAEIRPSSSVQSVTPPESPAVGGRYLVTTSTGATISAGAVVVAVGTPAATSRIIGGWPTLWPPLGPAAKVACLELGLSKPPPVRFILGVDEPLYLATHCPPANLAPEGGAVVHVMYYLSRDTPTSTDAIGDRLWDVARSAGVLETDVLERRLLASMTVTGAIPTALGGGLLGRPSVEVRPGLLLAGDWVGDTGLLADAAVASGALAGRAAASASTLAPNDLEAV